MSVTIRLARTGKKNAPSYKIVVANTKDKRSGRFLDVLGHYNPSCQPELFKMDKKKYEEWKKKGALCTKAVENLAVGTYTYIKYVPKTKKKGEEKEEPEKASEPKEEKEKEGVKKEKGQEKEEKPE